MPGYIELYNLGKTYETPKGPAVIVEGFNLNLAKGEIVALYLAGRDPRTPWYAKAMIAAVVAYALSPIDFIPDFIPILGYLDDLVLLPIGIWLAIRMIPAEILQDCRQRAVTAEFQLPRNWRAAVAIFFLWVTALILILYLVMVKPAIDSPSDARLGY